ncbi:MAG: proton-conducting transporter membrane subunit, partial [Methylophilaceae bacterium]
SVTQSVHKDMLVKNLTITLLPIDLAGLATLAWLALGVLGLLTPRRWIIGVLFPAGALVALLLAAAGMWRLQTDSQTIVLPLGLPDLPFHLRLDALSAFLLVLLGSVSFGIALYCAGYFRDDSRTSLSLFTLQYFVFLVGMTWVLLADDAYFFIVAWETMALASYFLVTTEHENVPTRHAGVLCLLIAHVGAIAILLVFGVLQGGHGDYTFATMRTAHPSEFWASITFLLALFGFGAKAELLPLHVWLPEAHRRCLPLSPP